ncbi:MAG: Txe/YoeB family addiction module toxin, partial [Candidatus Peribacteraceae bacterium]|nr:Txe/YoeB family addiction module toxin [Candidatus Peribacteraceae bacterium]
MSFRLVYTTQAVKDSRYLKKSPHVQKAKKILSILEKNPFMSPPTFEKLIGDLEGTYSRRLNIQHRIVY